MKHLRDDGSPHRLLFAGLVPVDGAKEGVNLVREDFDLGDDPERVPVAIGLQVGNIEKDFGQCRLKQAYRFEARDIVLVVVRSLGLNLLRKLVDVGQQLKSLALNFRSVSGAETVGDGVSELLRRVGQLVFDVKDALSNKALAA